MEKAGNGPGRPTRCAVWWAARCVQSGPVAMNFSYSAVALADLSKNQSHRTWHIRTSWSDCHPQKSILIFSRKGALRGNTINWLLKCLDTLRSLDSWCYKGPQAEYSWLCTIRSICLAKAVLFAPSFVCFSLVLGMGWDSEAAVIERRWRSPQIS